MSHEQLCIRCGDPLHSSGMNYGFYCYPCGKAKGWMTLEEQSDIRHGQQRTPRAGAMILAPGEEIIPLVGGGMTIRYSQPTPPPHRLTSHTYRRAYPAPTYFMMIGFLVRLVGWSFRTAGRVAKNTAVTSWDGHKIILGWWRGDGQLSRTDGLRVLAAISYLGAWFFGGIELIVSVLMAVLL